MLRRDALLSLLAAPLAWLRGRRKARKKRIGHRVFITKQDGDWSTPADDPASPWHEEPDR